MLFYIKILSFAIGSDSRPTISTKSHAEIVTPTAVTNERNGATRHLRIGETATSVPYRETQKPRMASIANQHKSICGGSQLCRALFAVPQRSTQRVMTDDVIEQNPLDRFRQQVGRDGHSAKR